MKTGKQARFPEAKVSAPFQLVMFAVAGFGGYLYMGNKVGDSQRNKWFSGTFFSSTVSLSKWKDTLCIWGWWDDAAWMSRWHVIRFDDLQTNVRSISILFLVQPCETTWRVLYTMFWRLLPQPTSCLDFHLHQHLLILWLARLTTYPCLLPYFCSFPIPERVSLRFWIPFAY